jgi:predicted  nucleic acid-binding Zn-ribbon protein
MSNFKEILQTKVTSLASSSSAAQYRTIINEAMSLLQKPGLSGLDASDMIARVDKALSRAHYDNAPQIVDHIIAVPIESQEDCSPYIQENKKLRRTIEEIVEDASEEIDHIQTNLNTVTKNWHDTQTRLTEADATIESVMLTIEVVEKNRKTTQDKLDAKKNELNTTQDKLAATQGELDANQAKLAAKKNELNTTQDKLNTTQGELTDTQGELTYTQGELTDTQGELDANQAKLADTQGELNTTQGELTDTQGELTDTQGELAAKKKNFSILRDAYSKLRDIYTKLQTKHDQLQAKYEQLQTDHEQLQAKYEQLQTDHEQLQAKYDQLQTEHDQLQTEHGQLQTEHGQLQTEHGQLQTEHGQLHKRCEQLQTDHEQLQAKYEQLQTDHKQLQTDHKQKQQKIADVELQLTDAEQTIRKGVNANENMSDEHKLAINKQLASIQELNKQIEQYGRKHTNYKKLVKVKAIKLVNTIDEYSIQICDMQAKYKQSNIEYVNIPEYVKSRIDDANKDLIALHALKGEVTNAKLVGQNALLTNRIDAVSNHINEFKLEITNATNDYIIQSINTMFTGINLDNLTLLNISTPIKEAIFNARALGTSFNQIDEIHYEKHIQFMKKKIIQIMLNKHKFRTLNGVRKFIVKLTEKVTTLTDIPKNVNKKSVELLVEQLRVNYDDVYNLFRNHNIKQPYTDNINLIKSVITDLNTLVKVGDKIEELDGADEEQKGGQEIMLLGGAACIVSRNAVQILMVICVILLMYLMYIIYSPTCHDANTFSPHKNTIVTV